MTDRDEILNRLKAQERDATHPPAWRSRRHFDDLAERFSTSLTASGGQVHRAGSLDAALAQLDALLPELAARQVAVNHEPPFDQLDLPGRWPNVDLYLAGQSGGDLTLFCASADVGLSGASAALAETGTIVLHNGPGSSRLVTLLPPIHIALVATSQLTTDIFTWTAARDGQIPASLTLVSGPSKTADIEQVLAIGVHGPKRLIVFLYDDD
ncbi:MAG: lactate utilization protein [Chloroflexota bacterium]|nr:lactate utilization protein [Chloroflexota bacterium]